MQIRKMGNTGKCTFVMQKEMLTYIAYMPTKPMFSNPANSGATLRHSLQAKVQRLRALAQHML